ncbi:MAG: hypothetical protein ACR2IS_01545 [Nitrososphaeraceae archaeon]
MKYAIFPYTYALDNRKDSELFALIVANAAIWVKTAEGIRIVIKVTTDMIGAIVIAVLVIDV